MDCPMLEKCRKVGLNCEDRKFTECDLYKRVLSEDRAEREKEKRKSWNEPQKEEERKEYARKWQNERYRKVKQLEEAKQIE